MRVTITVPDDIGEEAERLAAANGTSVSALYAEAVAAHVRGRRRRRAFAEIERLIGTTDVTPNAAAELEAMRRTDDHRID